MTSFDFQAGGTNHHYGRIAHWLAGYLWQHLPDTTINIKVGEAYRDLRAVGDGLAHMGVFTPAASARMCLEGQGPFERPRPALRAIGVVPHRDALVVAVLSELGLESQLDEVHEHKAPLRLLLPREQALTGHASRQVLALHGITKASLEGWGGCWIEVDSAQAAWKMMAAGEADAMINESVPQSFRPLSKVRPIRLLSMRPSAVEQLQAEHGYRWLEVPPGSVAGQEGPAIGLSWAHWIVVAHRDLPEEVGYLMADAFLNNAHQLERQYTADNRLPAEDCSLEYPMRPEVVANEVTVPLHTGAEKRYREAGVLREARA